MAKAILTLFLLCVGTLRSPIPENNIFNARAQTPIIEQAISDFQDICLTFMLHESAVSKFEDLKHFKSLIENSGYDSRRLTSMEDAASTMGVLGNSFYTPYTKGNEKFDLNLQWKQPYEHFNISKYSGTERETVLQMPYGKHNGVACRLRVELPRGTELSDIETEILDYDNDWIAQTYMEDHGQFSIFNNLQPRAHYYSQHVDFEQASFIFDITFEDSTIKTGRMNPFFNKKDTSYLTFSMRSPSGRAGF